MDVNAIAEISNLGIRRATCFLGLGVNAARDTRLKDYSLSDFSFVQEIPENIPDETISRFKVDFEHWIILSALRELIETFSVFLDAVCDATLHAAVNKLVLTPEAASTLMRKFEFSGLEGKFVLLRDNSIPLLKKKSI
jgi:hypothetical protein